MPQYDTYYSDSYLSHMKLIGMVEENKNVLDVGCSSGYLAEHLRKKGCKIFGIEKEKEAIKKAKEFCYNVIDGDLDVIESLPCQEKYFDVILFADILEHLKDPKRVLVLFKKYLKDDGCIILSIPNIANIRIRIKLLFGIFNYEKYGILDETHLRFFTKETIIELIKDSGYRILEYDITPGVPYKIQHYLSLSNRFCYGLAKRFDTLLSLQFILKAGIKRK